MITVLKRVGAAINEWGPDASYSRNREIEDICTEISKFVFDNKVRVCHGQYMRNEDSSSVEQRKAVAVEFARKTVQRMFDENRPRKARALAAHLKLDLPEIPWDFRALDTGRRAKSGGPVASLLR